MFVFCRKGGIRCSLLTLITLKHSNKLSLYRIYAFYNFCNVLEQSTLRPQDPINM